MSFRVIVRVCYDGDNESRIRNQVVPVLEASGLVRQGNRTGTWEGDPITPAQLTAIFDVLARLGDIQTNFVSAYHWTRLDHIWVYVTKSHALPAAPLPPNAEPDDAEGD